MTSKLKCPFCGEEIKIAGERTTIMSCFNGECYGSGLYGEEAMWKALIDGKKAQDALKEIKESVDAFKDSEFAEDMRDCVREVSRIIASITTEKDK